MTYNKTMWENRVPPRINGTNLNKIEQGIYDAHNDIVALNEALVTDLISDASPTLSGWTVDPTDAADITDGDISTFCNTGNKIAAGGYQYGIFEWDLGQVYNIITTYVGAVSVTAGTPYAYVYMYDGSNWIISGTSLAGSANTRLGHTPGGMASKVRLAITSNAAATITPNIREFHVWRL